MNKYMLSINTKNYLEIQDFCVFHVFLKLLKYKSGLKLMLLFFFNLELFLNQQLTLVRECFGSWPQSSENYFMGTGSHEGQPVCCNLLK